MSSLKSSINTGADPVPNSSVPSILWPALSNVNESLTLAILGQLLTTQWWSPEMILRRQLRQLTELVSYTAQTVPFYKESLAEFARPKRPLTVDDWRRLPILRRRDIQESSPSMVTRRPFKEHGAAADIRTSGSTGEPVVVKRNAVTGRILSALTIRDHLWHRRVVSGKLAYIRRLSGETEVAAKQGKSMPWIEGFPSGPMLFRDINEPLDETLEWLMREEPDYLMTYPTYLRALIQRSAEIGIQPSQLREVLTVGEALDPEVREACNDIWRAPISDVYSAQEVGVIAIQCPEHEHYLVQAEGIFCEVIDDGGAPCGPGEVGRVVVTPLHNFSMPLIRYDIGDYAEVGKRSPDGRGLPVLNRILGRARNMLLLPEGRKTWPAFGSRGMAAIAPIRQHQIVQKSTAALEARLVTERPLTPDEEERLARHITSRIPAPMSVAFTYLDEIPRSAGGKFEDFKTEIDL